MGRLPSEDRQYQLQSLNDKHHECCRLALLGYKPKQIARMLGVTEPTVCNAIHSAKGRELLSVMRGARDQDIIDLAKDIQEFAHEVFEATKATYRNPNLPDHLKLKYGIELMGLAGHVKPQRVQVQGAVAHLTSAEIEQIKQRAKLLADKTEVIDVEYQESEQGELSDKSLSDLDTTSQIAEH